MQEPQEEALIGRGNVTHFLHVIEGRSHQTLFRRGSKDIWSQITGSQFLLDLGRAQRILAMPECEIPEKICVHSYEDLVFFLALLLSGRSVFLHAEGVPAAKNAQSLWQRETSNVSIDISQTIGMIHAEDGQKISLGALVQRASQVLQLSEVEHSRPRHTGARWLSLASGSSLLMHVCWLAAVLENGVFGFSDPELSWQENFRILRPTIVAGAQQHVQWIAQAVREVSKRAQIRWRVEHLFHAAGLFRTPLMREAFADLCTVLLDGSSSCVEDEKILRDSGLLVVRFKPDQVF